MNITQLVKENAILLVDIPVAIIWVIDEKIVFINKTAKTCLKINQTNSDLNKVFDQASIKKLNTVIISKKEKKKLRVRTLKNKNQVLVNAKPIKIEKKPILQLTFLESEIKQKPINASKERLDLINKNNQLHTIFETSNHLIWLVNRKNEVTAFNKNFSDLIFEKYKLRIKPGQDISKLINKDVKKYTEFWYSKYSQAFEGSSLVFIKEETHKKYICRQVFIKPIFNDDKKIEEICCIAHDITDSVLYERKVNSQKGRLTAIFDSSQHYIWTIDKKERLTSFNKNYFDLVTNLYQTQPYVGLVLNRGVLSNDKQYLALLNEHYQKAFKGIATSFELEMNDQENKNMYLEIFLNPIYNKNEVVEVSGIAHNITDKKTAHQKMEISLKEKEVLLKEVHHRVKNNMQVISSILNLQSFYVKDSYTLGLLKESQNRISTMAYIHESLYQNNSFSAVNFSEYIKRLIRNIISSYSFNSENIELIQEIDEIALSLDVAIPLGLIINELITNSIKHAFNGNKKGTIVINLSTENNFVFLNLMDNGIGLEEGFNIENSQSLGLQLVSTLIEQIGAKYELISQKNKGTKFNISFQI